MDVQDCEIELQSLLSHGRGEAMNSDGSGPPRQNPVNSRDLMSRLEGKPRVTFDRSLAVISSGAADFCLNVRIGREEHANMYQFYPTRPVGIEYVTSATMGP